MTESAMDQIIQAIGRTRLFTHSEELQCARLMSESGKVGERARERMVLANLRLVLANVRKIKIKYPTEMPFEDLYIEGVIGLKRATEKFDYLRGYKFSTYATWWVRQSILRAVETKGRAVYLPVALRAKHRKLRKAEVALAQELGRPASMEEFAERVGLDPKEISKLYSHFRPISSLNTPVREDSDTELMELIVDEPLKSAAEIIHQQDLRGRLEGLLTRNLPAMQVTAIQMTFGFGEHEGNLTNAQIAAELDISTEKLRTIRNAAMRKLKHPSIVNTLKQYV